MPVSSPVFQIIAGLSAYIQEKLAWADNFANNSNLSQWLGWQFISLGLMTLPDLFPTRLSLNDHNSCNSTSHLSGNHPSTPCLRLKIPHVWRNISLSILHIESMKDIPFTNKSKIIPMSCRTRYLFMKISQLQTWWLTEESTNAQEGSRASQILHYTFHIYMGSLLSTWINFNPKMTKLVRSIYVVK